MANDLNQCNFIGRLGKDVEIRYIPSGDAVASFSIAVGWKSKDKEGAEWVNVTAWGKLAEICGQYLKKGSRVFVSGRFKTEKYNDKDGVERYSVKIMADQMQILDPKESGDDDRAAKQSKPAKVEKQPERFSGLEDAFDEKDIPF